MAEFYEQVDAFGETILKWADPEDQFRGYTEVSTDTTMFASAFDE